MLSIDDQTGYFDHVSAVLLVRQHPIIILEEAALRWMGVAVSSSDNLDLLIKTSQLDDIIADLLATGHYERIDQDLDYRLNDPYVKQVPRLRHTGQHPFHDCCLSLWSEAVYMLSVAGPMVEVPDLFARNRNLMEERLDPAAADVISISYQTMIEAGRPILEKILAQSSESKRPVYVPSIPRFIDSLLDQHRYRQTHDTTDNSALTPCSLPSYHLSKLIRYLHLEKTYQREKLIPELAERNRADMEMRLDKYKRKPVLTSKNISSAIFQDHPMSVYVPGEGIRPFIAGGENSRQTTTYPERV